MEETNMWGVRCSGGLSWILVVLVISARFGEAVGWHAYDARKAAHMKAEECQPLWPRASETSSHKQHVNMSGAELERCPCYREATRPYPYEFVDRLKLWPSMTQYDEEHGESVYGSQWALEQIYRNQNPADCRKAKYLISGGWPYGFGSRVHMEGTMLAIAMHLGRVYLPHPDGDNIFWETQVPFCKNQNDLTLTCFYEKFSKCTLEDALDGTGGDVNHLRTYFMSDFTHAFEGEDGLASTISTLADRKSINVVATYGGTTWDAKAYVPHQMYPMLQCSPVREDLYYYWWRAVSASYIARPQSLTMRLLNDLHTHQLDTQTCIAMFVRHGDKGIEMNLLDFDLYRIVAEQMWQQGMLPASGRIQRFNGHFDSGPPKGLPRDLTFNGTLLITSEDPLVLQQADAFGVANNWRIAYTNLFDRAKQTAYKTWDEQHKKGAPAVHDNLEYVSMMLNLYYALQCEGWVCTLASNSCRIMDELRATVGGKANRHFADLSAETCAGAPCVADHGHIMQTGERRRDRRRRLLTH